LIYFTRSGGHYIKRIKPNLNHKKSTFISIITQISAYLNLNPINPNNITTTIVKEIVIAAKIRNAKKMKKVEKRKKKIFIYIYRNHSVKRKN
jgi:hypothetical protein